MSSILYPVIRSTKDRTECMGVFDMSYKALGFIMEHIVNAVAAVPSRFEYSKPILNTQAYDFNCNNSYWIYKIEVRDKRDDSNIEFYVLQTDTSDLSSTYKAIEEKKEV